jgi:hypothetical protein
MKTRIADMTFMEKINMAALVGYLVVFGAYFLNIFDDLQAAFGGAEIETSSLPMFVAIIGFVVLMIIASILIAIANPKAADEHDERDKLISMRGDQRGGQVLGLFALGALTLALLDFPAFLIANAILAGLVGGEIVKTLSVMVDYRRGLV